MPNDKADETSQLREQLCDAEAHIRAMRSRLAVLEGQASLWRDAVVKCRREFRAYIRNRKREERADA